MRQKLEQAKREAREMRAMEAEVKWKMKRDEEKQKQYETREDEREIMLWRQDRKKGLTEYASQSRQHDKIETLRDAREFQDFKRYAKQADKEDEMQLTTELYKETKEYSDYHVDLKRILPLEEEKRVVDDNLERYTTLAMHQHEMVQIEKLETKLAREQEEDTKMADQLLQAKKARDEALQSLEYVRAKGQMLVSTNRDIRPRPFQSRPCH
jgi:hypothetical protein